MTDRFVVLRTKSTNSNKDSWALWMREGDNTAYSMLIARIYDEKWAQAISEALNVGDE